MSRVMRVCWVVSGALHGLGFVLSSFPVDWGHQPTPGEHLAWVAVAMAMYRAEDSDE